MPCSIFGLLLVLLFHLFACGIEIDGPHVVSPVWINFFNPEKIRNYASKNKMCFLVMGGSVSTPEEERYWFSPEETAMLGIVRPKPLQSGIDYPCPFCGFLHLQFHPPHLCPSCRSFFTSFSSKPPPPSWLERKNEDCLKFRS